MESLGLPADRSGLPNSPLTLEKACEFVSSWRRHHSREDLATSDSEDFPTGKNEEDSNDNKRRSKRHGSSSGYTRFDRVEVDKDDEEEEDGEEEDECDDDEDDDDDDDEDEESSTEVEDGW